MARTWPSSAVKWLERVSVAATDSPEDPLAQVEADEVAFVLGGADSLSSARFLARRDLTTGSHDLLNQPGAKAPQQAHDRIGKLRSRLRAHPEQALLWSELARNFTIAGSDAKAKSAMSTALHLAPTSHYLRRSAARMFLHFEEGDRALQLLRVPSITANSPLMLAAEIAVSRATGRPSRFANTGKSVFADANFSKRSLSELGAALGTLELEHGKHKKARAYFSRTTEAPTENALAQVQWASELDNSIHIPEDAWLTPNNFEARTLRFRQDLKWDDVLAESENWLNDEPFSSRPAALSSFACFSEYQNRASESIATRGLQSEPGRIELLNNRSVARSYLGKLDGAYSDIRRALDDSRGPESPHLLATLGLLAYRSGDIVLGSTCYAGAMSWFIHSKRKLSAILAALYWTREIARLNPSEAVATLDLIKSKQSILGGGAYEPEIASMLTHVERLLEAQEATELSGRFEMPSEDLQRTFDRFSFPPAVENRLQTMVAKLF